MLHCTAQTPTEHHKMQIVSSQRSTGCHVGNHPLPVKLLGMRPCMVAKIVQHEDCKLRELDRKQAAD